MTWLACCAARRLVEEVECASDGQDALVKASAHHYDAIFLDVKMPDLDGVQLGRVLRRFAAPPALVFVSAYDSAAVDAFELRAFDYLLKPVGRRRLEEALERVAGAVHDEAGASGARPADHGPSAAAGSGPGDSEVIAVANLRGAATRLISRGSVLYLQSHGDFVRVVTADGRYLLRATLADIAQRLGAVRVRARAPPVRRESASTRSRSVRSSAAPRSWPSVTVRRSRSPVVMWPSWGAASESERRRRRLTPPRAPVPP